MLFISQSGETADTLAAMEKAGEQGNPRLALVNVRDSSMSRTADVLLPTRAGIEVGVASTKAFTAQLSVLSLLALESGRANYQLSAEQLDQRLKQLNSVPKLMEQILQRTAEISSLAKDIANYRNVLYLGRGINYALAREGALKLKEISYLHAEAYPAGELKHGPIALIDDQMPVVAIAPRDRHFDKTLSNLREVTARGGKVLMISDAEGIKAAEPFLAWSIEMPSLDPFVAPLLYCLPLQLLAYETALARGTDVDQPRNLAKSVTVE